MDEMRLIVLGVGVVIIALIYLWGMRSRIKSKLQERRRRAAARLPENQPVLDGTGTLAADESQDRASEAGSAVGARDPFAHQRLVDVEIGPVKRMTPDPADMGGALDATAGAKTRTMAEVTPLPRSEGRTGAKPAFGSTARLAGMPNKSAPRPASPWTRNKEQTAKEGVQEPELTVVMTVIAPSGQPFKGRRVQAVAEPLGLKLSNNGVFECFPDDGGRDSPVFGIGHLREPGTFAKETLESMETPGLLLFMRLPGPLDGVSSLNRMVAAAGQLAERLGGMVCDDRRNKMTNQALIHLRTEVVELERRRRVWSHSQRG